MNGMDRRAIPLGEGPDLAVNGWLGRGGTILRRRGLAPSTRQPSAGSVLVSSMSFASQRGNAGLAAAGSGTFQGWMDPEPAWADTVGNPGTFTPAQNYLVVVDRYIDGVLLDSGTGIGPLAWPDVSRIEVRRDNFYPRSSASPPATGGAIYDDLVLRLGPMTAAEIAAHAADTLTVSGDEWLGRWRFETDRSNELTGANRPTTFGPYAGGYDLDLVAGEGRSGGQGFGRVAIATNALSDNLYSRALAATPFSLLDGFAVSCWLKQTQAARGFALGVILGTSTDIVFSVDMGQRDLGFSIGTVRYSLNWTTSPTASFQPPTLASQHSWSTASVGVGRVLTCNVTVVPVT